MKRLFFLFAFSLLLLPGLRAQTAVELKQETGPEVEWLSWEEMVKRMEKEPRLILVDVYTDWCGWCKRMDATTMHDPRVTNILSSKYYAVKMDGEYKEDIVFKGTTFKFVANGRRGYHELPAQLMNGRMSYPTLVFLNSNYDIIQPLPGYKAPEELEPILVFFADKHYESTSWENFLQDFQAKKANEPTGN